MLKKLICSVVAVAVLLTSVACNSNPGNSTYDVPEYDNDKTITILADASPNPVDANMSIYAEAGFNTYNLYPGVTENIEDVVALCEKYGLDLYIFGGSRVVPQNVAVFPNAIGDFPNFFVKFNDTDLNQYDRLKGLYMIDEPGAELFDDIAEYYVPWYNENYTDKIWHINLYPSHATPSLFQCEAEDGLSVYETYIKKYAEEVLSKVEGNNKNISVDHYPLRKRGRFNYVSDMFLHDLMLVGRTAKQSGATFSACIQAYGDGMYRLPESAGDIRLQVYTALACGAKSLEYYAYESWSPEEGITKFGTRQPLYYYVQEVNREIAKFGNVLCAFDWEGVMTVTGSENANEENGFSAVSNWTMNKLSGVRSVSAKGDAVIGQKKDKDGNLGFVVVNYTEPTSDYFNTVDFEFENAKAVLMYRNGVKMIIEIKNNKISVPLEGGEGVFLIPLK